MIESKTTWPLKSVEYRTDDKDNGLCFVNNLNIKKNRENATNSFYLVLNFMVNIY